MIHKLCEKETGEQLVNGSRSGHIVDHAVDQFHTDVVRNGIIIFQCIVSLLFDEIGAEASRIMSVGFFGSSKAEILSPMRAAYRSAVRMWSR